MLLLPPPPPPPTLSAGLVLGVPEDMLIHQDVRSLLPLGGHPVFDMLSMNVAHEVAASAPGTPKSGVPPGRKGNLKKPGVCWESVASGTVRQLCGALCAAVCAALLSITRVLRCVCIDIIGWHILGIFNMLPCFM